MSQNKRRTESILSKASRANRRSKEGLTTLSTKLSTKRVTPFAEGQAKSGGQSG